MKKRLDKTTIEFQMFADYWKIVQDFYEPEDDESYWSKLIKETNEFYNKYKTDFAKALIMAFDNEIERKWKENHRSK